MSNHYQPPPAGQGVPTIPAPRDWYCCQCGFKQNFQRNPCNNEYPFNKQRGICGHLFCTRCSTIPPVQYTGPSQPKPPKEDKPKGLYKHEVRFANPQTGPTFK